MEKKFVVISEYKSPYPEDLIFKKGKVVKVGNEFSDDPDWKNWVWCQGEIDQRAWIPTQYIGTKNNKSFLNTDYNALELTLSVGEELIGTMEINGFTMARNKNGEVGWAPLRNLKRK